MLAWLEPDGGDGEQYPGAKRSLKKPKSTFITSNNVQMEHYFRVGSINIWCQMVLGYFCRTYLSSPILHKRSLFSKIRCSLTYLPIWRQMWMFPYEKLGTFLAKTDQVSLIFCEIKECRADKNWVHFSARVQNLFKTHWQLSVP